MRGAYANIGHCYEMEGSPPYVPFIEMLEHTARTAPKEGFRRVLGDDALRNREAHAGTAADVSGYPGGDSVAARTAAPLSVQCVSRIHRARGKEHPGRSWSSKIGATFLKLQEAFERVGRRINWAQRNYQIALKQLLDIRAKRAHDQETAEPEAHIEENYTPNHAIPKSEAATRRAETESLNPKLVSFLPEPRISPKSVQNTPTSDPETEENPPTAA